MCGRYANFRRDEEVAAAFRVEELVGEAPPPSWNVAPMQPVRTVLERASRSEPDRAPRQLRTVQWGLVPSWAKDPGMGARLINARSETVTEKPSFKTAAARRRCLLPAEGYYEWQKLDGGRKQPYFLHDQDERPLGFAGLYELWPDPALPADHPDRWRWTATILTTRAADALGHIHDRTPVIVPPDLVDDWLDPGITDPGTVRSMVAAMPSPALVPRPVSAAVGNVRNDGPHLIEPAAAERP